MRTASAASDLRQSAGVVRRWLTAIDACSRTPGIGVAGRARPRTGDHDDTDVGTDRGLWFSRMLRATWVVIPSEGCVVNLGRSRYRRRRDAARRISHSISTPTITPRLRPRRLTTLATFTGYAAVAITHSFPHTLPDLDVGTVSTTSSIIIFSCNIFTAKRSMVCAARRDSRGRSSRPQFSTRPEQCRMVQTETVNRLQLGCRAKRAGKMDEQLCYVSATVAERQFPGQMPLRPLALTRSRMMVPYLRRLFRLPHC